MRVAIDQDQVIADLNSKWLQVYNEEWDDSLQDTDITDWDIARFTKPDCSKKIYDIIQRPGFYLDLPVIEGARDGVISLLDMGCDITVVSASPMSAYMDKHIWLNTHFPEVDNIIFAQDKSWINADILIDDGLHNLEDFTGDKLLFDAPYNKREHRFVRVKNWNEIVKWIQVKMGRKKAI